MNAESSTRTPLETDDRPVDLDAARGLLVVTVHDLSDVERNHNALKRAVRAMADEIEALREVVEAAKRLAGPLQYGSDLRAFREALKKAGM